MTPHLELSLLGGTQIRCGKTSVTGFRSSKATALLCYLAVTATSFPRPFVADLFWPDLSEAHANDSLRVTLSNLRNLAGDHLVITRQSISFNMEIDHYLDVRHFQKLADVPAHAVAVEHLREAIALYHGDFMAGFHVHDAPAFEQWAAIQQMQLHDLAVRILHTLVAYYTQSSGGQMLAVEYGNRLLALEPWEEETYQLLMLLLAASGQRAAAYRQYEICRGMLWRESGTEPGDETNEIVAQIRRGALKPEDALRQVTAITTRFGVLPVPFSASSTLPTSVAN